MIGFILIGISFIGKEAIGGIYTYAITIGILMIFTCIVLFVLTEAKK